MKFKKSDWYAARISGEIADDEVVKMWSLPHGCRCSVSEWDGSAILKNGETSAVNTSIARVLLDAGISDDILINSTNSLPQTVSRWLTWWLSNKPTLDDPAYRSIRVAVFNTLPKHELPFEVEVLQPYTVKASEVLDVLSVKSSDTSLSLIAVERFNGERYELEPIRYVSGTVLSYSKHGYVVMPINSPSRTPILVGRVSRSTRAIMELSGISESSIVGARVRVQYTMFTPGKRMSNYKGAVIYSIDGVRWESPEDIAEVSAANNGGYMYPSPLEGGRRSLLTPARCGRATIEIVPTDRGMYFDACEHDKGLPLFKFEQDVECGNYAVLLNRHGVSELWKFNTVYNVDVLAPNSLTRHIDDNLYHSTGYSVDELGILYKDINGVFWLGGNRLPSDVRFAKSVECVI